MLPLLIIKTGQKLPELEGIGGDFEDWMLAGMGWTHDQALVVRVQDGEPLPERDAVCGALITGSGAMVTEREPWSELAARWLANAVSAGLPTLGICYGHQLLAHALGGDVANNPAGIEVGTVSTTLTPEAAGDALFRHLPTDFPVQASHKQSVITLPSGAHRLAASASDPNHAFRYGHAAWGIQFHPEFDERIVGYYIDYYQAQLPRGRDDTRRLHAQLQPTPLANSLLRRFGEFILAR